MVLEHYQTGLHLFVCVSVCVYVFSKASGGYMDWYGDSLHWEQTDDVSWSITHTSHWWELCIGLVKSTWQEPVDITDEQSRKPK